MMLLHEHAAHRVSACWGSHFSNTYFFLKCEAAEMQNHLVCSTFDMSRTKCCWLNWMFDVTQIQVWSVLCVVYFAASVQRAQRCCRYTPSMGETSHSGEQRLPRENEPKPFAASLVSAAKLDLITSSMQQLLIHCSQKWKHIKSQ